MKSIVASLIPIGVSIPAFIFASKNSFWYIPFYLLLMQGGIYWIVSLFLPASRLPGFLRTTAWASHELIVSLVLAVVLSGYTIAAIQIKWAAILITVGTIIVGWITESFGKFVLWLIPGFLFSLVSKD